MDILSNRVQCTPAEIAKKIGPVPKPKPLPGTPSDTTIRGEDVNHVAIDLNRFNLGQTAPEPAAVHK